MTVELEGAKGELEGKLATTAAELEETASTLVEQTALTVELEGAKGELEGELATTATMVTEIEAQLEELRGQYAALVAESGTAAELRNKIAELEERLKPLVLASGGSRITGVACTGSMEPVLTCLDKVTLLPRRYFQPEDVVVGVTIYFSPDCWGVERGALHRVADVRVTDGGEYEYWPKGDGNEEPDGCWVPYSNVISYIIEIDKNAQPQNAELRDNVNAAWAAYVVVRDVYLDLIES